MKRTTPIVLLLALAILLLCCACGGKTAPEISAVAPEATPEVTEPPKDTPAQIAEKMEAALEKTPCGHAELVMNMTMAMDDGAGSTMEMKIKSTSDIIICQSPLSCRTVVTGDMEAEGEPSTTVSESYAVMEGDALVTYVCSDGIWMKLENAQTAEQLKNAASSVNIDKTNVKVDESVTAWQGKPAICLTSTVTGDALDSVLDGLLDGYESEGGSIADAAELLNAANYDALHCDLRIYLDAATYLPIEEEMILEGMTEVMAPIYENLGYTVDVTDCTGVGRFLSYDAQAEITLPEGAAEKAEVWGRLLADESDNGDGTYTIREGAVLADIIAPEGFEEDEHGYDHVYFMRDDYRQVGYSMWYLVGDEEDGNTYFREMIKGDTDFYKELGALVDSVDGTYSAEKFDFTCLLVDLQWSAHEDAEAYGWVALANDDAGTYFLFVEIYDGYDDGLGNIKDADLTEEDFQYYLNCAAVSWLTPLE